MGPSGITMSSDKTNGSEVPGKQGKHLWSSTPAAIFFSSSSVSECTTRKGLVSLLFFLRRLKREGLVRACQGTNDRDKIYMHISSMVKSCSMMIYHVNACQYLYLDAWFDQDSLRWFVEVPLAFLEQVPQIRACTLPGHPACRSSQTLLGPPTVHSQLPTSCLRPAIALQYEHVGMYIWFNMRNMIYHCVIWCCKSKIVDDICKE